MNRARMQRAAAALGLALVTGVAAVGIGHAAVDPLGDMAASVRGFGVGVGRAVLSVAVGAPADGVEREEARGDARGTAPADPAVPGSDEPAADPVAPVEPVEVAEPAGAEPPGDEDAPSGDDERRPLLRSLTEATESMRPSSEAGGSETPGSDAGESEALGSEVAASEDSDAEPAPREASPDGTVRDVLDLVLPGL